MLRSIWLVFVYLAFLGLGAYAPFVFALGYVWVDTFRPQEVAYIVLNQLPVAMIMGAAAVGSYLLLDRRSPPKLTFITVAQFSLAVWSTITLLWAVSPDRAWIKWDWAFKTMMFAVFIPFVIRSRVQIEAFLQVYYFSLVANLLPFGVKIILSGGGYGRSLGLSEANYGLGEGSTFAAVAVMTIPIAMYLANHGQLLPKSVVVKLMYYGMSALAIFTTIGTFQRTGLVGLVILGIGIFLKSRRKIMTLALVLGIGTIIAYATSGAWTARISTIATFQQDSSAMVRILVWQWTLNYVLANPLGGGFEMYAINRIELPTEAMGSEVEVQNGRAFHSIYFEVLGEHGWIGIVLFVVLLVGAQLVLRRVARLAKATPGMEWCQDLARTLQVCLAVMSVCGSFIGIAYQPFIHYLLALTVCTAECLRRTMNAAVVGPIGWRAQTLRQQGSRADAGIGDIALPRSAVTAGRRVPDKPFHEPPA
jgi:putative inorganic carbon (HCO3(-)) transporter